MSLRVRFALYAFAIVGVVVLGLYLGASRVLLQSFGKLEMQGMVDNLERTESAWESQHVRLVAMAKDYASWDDTYKFIIDHNQSYIESNLSEDIALNLDVNFFAFIDNAEKIVATEVIDLATGERVPLKESVRAYLTRPETPLQHQNVQSRTSGLVILPDGALLIASAPIITTDYRGPIRGSVIMGKFVSERIMEDLSALTQLQVRVYRLDDSTLPQHILDARDDLLTNGGKLSQPLSETQIAGYTLLNDLSGEPALLMQIEAPRVIYAQAQRSRHILTGLTLAVGLTAALLLLLLLQAGILRRFAQLSAAVEEIAESGDTTRRLALPGRDELARVGHDIDVMLTALETAQGRTRESEARYARAVKGVNDGLWDWNLVTNTVYYSARFASMLGYPESARDESPALFFSAVHPDDLARVHRTLDDHLAGCTPQFESEFRMSVGAPSDRPDYRFMLSRGVAAYNADGEAVSITGSLTDISQRGIFDPLTGLPNRLLLTSRLTHSLETTTRETSNTAVLFLDLNRFKVINDSLGHHVGDLLLIEVARRLQRVVRHGDTVARLGGDEFVVLLEDLTHEGVVKLLERMTTVLAEPYELEGHLAQTSASIGVVRPLPEHLTVEDILRDADIAMFEAKKTRQPFLHFGRAMRERAVTRQQLESDLRQALHKQELFLVYQPIVSRGGGVVSFEALLRWQHPARGLVSPADFIPLAEETGLIVNIGRWVLEEVCKRLHSSPNEQLSIAVNLSPRQLGDPNLADWLATLLARTGVRPERLRLEITEGAVMEQPDRMIGLLTQLRSLGVKLAMDDFGTGYSSLSYVHDLPIDTLKVDRSFVSRITFDDKSLEVVRTIMALAERLGLEVVAEGVETAAQVRLLAGLGCTLMQGFYYAKPCPWEQVGGLHALTLETRLDAPVEGAAYSA